MTDVVQLSLVPKGHPVEIDLGDVAKQPTGAAAIALCATKSGLLDKIIAADLGLQDAVWSRVKSGQNNLSLDALVLLMQRCGNEAPLQWLLLKMGYNPASLARLESEETRRRREAEQRAEAAEDKLRVVMELMRELRGVA